MGGGVDIRSKVEGVKKKHKWRSKIMEEISGRFGRVERSEGDED